MTSTAIAPIADSIDELREAILSLEPDGEDGLEGLVAHALASLLGRQFRVAKSGRQHGRDGATNPGTFDVFFEAKLYSGKPPSTESLQAKLLSAINDHQPYLDLWVVACTAPIGENSVKEIISSGERFGVTVVVLDWSRHPLPPLAVLLASAGDAVSDWLAQHAQLRLRPTIESGLAAVSIHPSYATTSAEIVQSLSPATAGWGAARVRNSAWLATTLVSRRKARQVFGQFIAPDDPTLPAIARQRASQAIATAMADHGNSIIALIGEEGTGKTWLTAMAWESLAIRPIFLLCTTDNSAWETALREPLQFLAQLLIEHTGGIGSNDAKERWLRRLDNWAKRESSEPRIWLVLDGLNERESRPWSAVVDQLMELAPGLGVRLLVTSRPVFFRDRVLPRLTGYAVRQIKAEPFTEQDVLDAMRSRGVDAASVPDAVREFLRNPRIFSIAIGMLDRVKPDELTRERLLFEYWRKRFEERRSLHHNDGDMRRLLVSHAQTIRANIQTARGHSAASFRRDLWKEHSGPAQRIANPTIDDELTEVESGRFFEPDPDRDGNYRIRPEGLAYALGLLIIDEIRNAPEAEMPARIEAAIDPIRGLDLMADVMLAAVGVACIDTQCPDALAAALLHSLLDIQNLPDASAETVLAYVPARPAAFIAAAELQWGDVHRHSDRGNWLAWLLHQRREHDAVRPQLDTAIRRWLALWCPEPDQMPRHALSGQDAEKEKTRTDERRARITHRQETLTAEERAFFERHCHKINESTLMSIDSLALDLLAGRPLAPFADAIVAWQFCDSLTGRIYSSSGVEAELSWLLRLNPVDLHATAQALHQTLSKIESETASVAGLWTAIGTLRGTGLPGDAMRAEELYRKLPPSTVFPGWRRIENFCDTDPIDPHSSTPTNLARAIETVGAIEAGKFRASMSMTREDHDIGDLTPALARFAPEILVDKLRAFARDMGQRSGHAARFLAFQLPKFSALLTATEADSLRGAYFTFAAGTEAGDSDERDVGVQYLLMALLPHLDAADQLQALLALPGDKGEMTQLRRFFKPLDPEALTARLEQAEKNNSVRDLRRTLFFASTGQTPLTEGSRAAIQRCFIHPNHVIRLIAFDAAAECNDEPLIAALAESNWSGLTDGSESVQSFYGSKVLARAPDRFQGADTLMRMTLGWQTAVIDAWGEESVRRHADIITQLIRKSLNLPSDLISDIPVQRNIETTATPTAYPFMDTGPETPKKENDFAKLKQTLDGTDESWRAEQVRKKEAVQAYIAKLEKHDVARLVDPIYMDGFESVASRAADAFEGIISLLLKASDRQLRSLASIAACAATVLSRAQPDKAGELFEHLLHVTPDVNLNIGPAEVPFCRLALWTAQDGERIKRLRAFRLQSGSNDAELFVEVLCAAKAGKMAEVLVHAEQLMATEHPGQIARAVTLAGFCDVNEVSPRIFDDPRLKMGFLSQVTEAARGAYERNAWARHWYEEACAATDAVQFWRSCALMIRAADGRFILWFDPDRDLKQVTLMPFARFAGDSLKDRAKDKRKDREKMLFGVRPPSSEMLAAMTELHSPTRAAVTV
jgi:hypothetical protein